MIYLSKKCIFVHLFNLKCILTVKKLLFSLLMLFAFAAANSVVAQNSSLVPPAGQLPNGDRKVYYTNNSRYIISVATSYAPNGTIVRGNYWRAIIFVYKGGGPGTGYMKYFELKSNGNGVWGFSETDMWGKPMSSGAQLYIAHNWSYVKVGNDVYNVPISKQQFDSMQPRSRVSMGGNGGGSSSGSNSSGSSYQTGPSHIDKKCQYCGGGGGCRSCNGTGLKYNPYSGHHEKCPSCNGSGRCFNCRGTGKQATY